MSNNENKDYLIKVPIKAITKNGKTGDGITDFSTPNFVVVTREIFITVIEDGERKRKTIEQKILGIAVEYLSDEQAFLVDFDADKTRVAKHGEFNTDSINYLKFGDYICYSPRRNWLRDRNGGGEIFARFLSQNKDGTINYKLIGFETFPRNFLGAF